MSLLDFFRSTPAVQTREAPAPQTYALSEKAIRDWLTNGDAGQVSEDQAFTVPAINSAVTLISNTVASLPFHLFTKAADGSRARAGAKDPATKLIEQVVNVNYLTSSAWLRWAVTRLLIDGRAITFIERNQAGRATNLWPQQLSDIEARLVKGVIQYVRRSDGAVFEAGEVLDFILRPGAEPYSHRSILEAHASTINQWLKIERYGSALFANGGVSPLIATINAASPEALARAREDLARRIKQDRADNLPVTTLPGGPNGVQITPLGHDPQKQQLLETKQYLVVEFARMFNVHPAMIQDHSRSTFTNTEQADLNYSKHCISPICTIIEAELNVKMFSDRNRSSFVEFNLDGLQRGDQSSRYTAFGQGIQNGFITPDEVRQKENLPAKGGKAGSLFIQGATVPLDSPISPEKLAA